ncbi:TolC family protein [bacterium]|nr:TolC family protein [bacterium]
MTASASIVATILLTTVPNLIAPAGAASPEREAVTLSEALDLATSRNPALGAAKAQQRAAEAGVREARSAYFPHLSLAGSYSRYDQKNVVVPIHETGVFPPLDDDIYEGVVRATVPLFNGGRTGASVRAASAFTHENQVQAQLSRVGILRGVGRIYLGAAELADRVALVEARATILRERRRELSLRLAEGRVAPSDLAMVDSSIEALRSDSLRITLNHLELALELGRLLDTGSPVEPELPPIRANPEVPDSLLPVPESSSVPGPLVRKAQARLQYAEARSDHASTFFWPDVAGFGSYVLRSGGDLDGTGEWVAGVRVELPLFDAGRRSSAKSAAEASADAAREQLKGEWSSHRSALRAAEDIWRVSGQRREHLAAAVRLKTESVEAYRELYGSGRIALSELLTQEAELLDLGMDERQAAYEQRHALLDYQATLGALSGPLVETIVEGNMP